MLGCAKAPRECVHDPWDFLVGYCEAKKLVLFNTAELCYKL